VVSGTLQARPGFWPAAQTGLHRCLLRTPKELGGSMGSFEAMLLVLGGAMVLTLYARRAA
jgi:hypothetical protein